MRVLSETRGLATNRSRPPILLNSVRVDSSQLNCRPQWRASYHITPSSSSSSSSGNIYGNCLQVGLNHWDNALKHPTWFVIQRQLFSSESSAVESAPRESVKQLHDKILKSISEQKTAPPNAWLWSLIQQSGSHEDIKPLFNTLQRL